MLYAYKCITYIYRSRTALHSVENHLIFLLKNNVLKFL